MLPTGFWKSSHSRKPLLCGSGADRVVSFPVWIIFFLDDILADMHILIGLIVMFFYCKLIYGFFR